MPTIPSLRQMLENGVHFGHMTSRWNPRMKPFIYTERDKVHVINLEQTRSQLERALRFLTNVVENGGTVLLVGTKRQAKDIVKATAEHAQTPYVVERWFGGTLTNFTILRKNIKVLEEMEQAGSDEAFQRLTKKERLRIEEKRDKLGRLLEGVRNMTRVPDALFIVDTGKESIAVNEAATLHIPVVALVDTNANPKSIDYPIPANDDATKSLTLLLGVIGSALEEARETHLKKQVQAPDNSAVAAKALAKETVVPEQQVASEQLPEKTTESTKEKTPTKPRARKKAVQKGK